MSIIMVSREKLFEIYYANRRKFFCKLRFAGQYYLYIEWLKWIVYFLFGQQADIFVGPAQCRYRLAACLVGLTGAFPGPLLCVPQSCRSSSGSSGSILHEQTGPAESRSLHWPRSRTYRSAALYHQ